MDWTSSYRNKLTTAEQAVQAIKSGDHVYVHPGCAVPEVLIRAMIGQIGRAHV